jgi:hypothetical protein
MKHQIAPRIEWIKYQLVLWLTPKIKWNFKSNKITENAHVDSKHELQPEDREGRRRGEDERRPLAACIHIKKKNRSHKSKQRKRGHESVKTNPQMLLEESGVERARAAAKVGIGQGRARGWYRGWRGSRRDARRRSFASQRWLRVAGDTSSCSFQLIEVGGGRGWLRRIGERDKISLGKNKETAGIERARFSNIHQVCRFGQWRRHPLTKRNRGLLRNDRKSTYLKAQIKRTRIRQILFKKYVNRYLAKVFFIFRFL